MSNLYWKRVRPGLYVSTGVGAPRYTVGKTETGEWFCEGPGADGVLPTKHEAQAACQLASYELRPPC